MLSLAKVSQYVMIDNTYLKEFADLRYTNTMSEDVIMNSLEDLEVEIRLVRASLIFPPVPDHKFGELSDLRLPM